LDHPKFIIEVRINEYTDRQMNLHVPFTPEEIAEDVAECVRNGASIIHYHARDPKTGAPTTDADVCMEIERQIRKKLDVITMPTLGAHIVQSEGRIGHILEMAKDPMTKPDCVPIDLVTTNMALYNSDTGDFERDDRTYENSIADLKRLCQRVKAVGVKPIAMLWNVASVRVTEVFMNLGLFDDPLYCEVVLFDGKTLGFGHPGTIKGMYSMLEFFPRNANWHWSAHSHGNTLGIAAGAIEAGGHATLGLGDYHYPELGLPTNGQLVAYVAGMARAMGREVATVAEAREMLGMQR
jgi:3-keto-5-aminohexanoate cleavage enzyme